MTGSIQEERHLGRTLKDDATPRLGRLLHGFAVPQALAWMSRGYRLPRARLRTALVGIAALALITAFAFRLHLGLTTAALLQLMVVVLAAREGGFIVASALSAIAVASQLYFFVPPILGWSVADPLNWVALFSFEYCALVVSRLWTAAALESASAEARRKEFEWLYETSRFVLLMDLQADPVVQLADLVHRIYGFPVVVVFDAVSARAASAGLAGAEVERRTRDTYLQAQNWFDPADQTWFRVLCTGTRPTGAMALRGPGMSASVADALAVLIALALERVRSLELENLADAIRQSDQIRTVLLDALAHDVKTPLTAIRTASSGLLERRDCLSATQAELVGLIDQQSDRINEITDRLLRMARLDAKELRLQRTAIPVRKVLEEAVAEARRSSPGRSIRQLASARNASFVGDENLILIAMAQVLDNALKYAATDSVITVGVEQNHDTITLFVHNVGNPIPSVEIGRVFERFYRVRHTARRTAGTGLGLAITRKIVTAHGGSVGAVSDEVQGTTFSMSFPTSKE